MKLIPGDKQEAVRAALHATFGVPHFDDISRLTGGLSSALLFRIAVKGKSYVLRIITRTDALNDPTRQFECMTRGAEAGIAPAIRYLSIPDRISITDYLETQAFPAAEARSALPILLRRLHALPGPAREIHSVDTANLYLRKYLDAAVLPAEFTAGPFTAYEQVSRAYPRMASDMVLSHNDLKPENILYDGRQPWLIDWEAAFVNDRFSDLSIIANFTEEREEQEAAYLAAYFGREPTPVERARLYLMQQVMHISYFTVFMVVLAGRGYPMDLERVEVPDYRSFNNRMWDWQIDLADDRVKFQYALTHLAEFRRNMELPRFREAIRLVS